MTRFICIILFSQYICITAQASSCYLMPDLNNPEILKIEKRSQRTKDTICKVDCSESDAEVYKVQVLKGKELGLIDRAKEFVGLDVEKIRDWSPGDKLERDEKILCRVDSKKLQAKIDLKESKKAAKQRLEKQKQDAWKTACDKKEIHPLICRYKGI